MLLHELDIGYDAGGETPAVQPVHNLPPCQALQIVQWTDDHCPEALVTIITGSRSIARRMRAGEVWPLPHELTNKWLQVTVDAFDNDESDLTNATMAAQRVALAQIETSAMHDYARQIAPRPAKWTQAAAVSTTADAVEVMRVPVRGALWAELALPRPITAARAHYVALALNSSGEWSPRCVCARAGEVAGVTVLESGTALFELLPGDVALKLMASTNLAGTVSGAVLTLSRAAEPPANTPLLITGTIDATSYVASIHTGSRILQNRKLRGLIGVNGGGGDVTGYVQRLGFKGDLGIMSSTGGLGTVAAGAAGSVDAALDGYSAAIIYFTVTAEATFSAYLEVT